MVTREQLHEHLGRRPFRPFRVALVTGETIDITRVAQAVASPRQLIVGTPDDRWRWVELSKIARVDVYELPQASTSK